MLRIIIKACTRLCVLEFVGFFFLCLAACLCATLYKDEKKKKLFQNK